MAVEIQVKMDIDVIRQMKDIERKYGQKCVERAEKDAVKAGKTAMSGAAREIFTLKKKDLDSFVKTYKDSIVVESRPLTVGETHFSVTPKQYASQKGIPMKRRKKINAEIKKGRKTRMRRVFILNPDTVINDHQTVGKSMLWQETGKVVKKMVNGKEVEFKKVKPFKSASAAQIVSKQQVVDKTEEKMKETFEKRLEHYAEREMKRIANH